ncbi:MAG: hypothetical protein QOE68_839, partial [Thermoanaerobaculia bacterium]|nr:hypothetical protein [Thermoanaerobaculia bacterium]
MSVLISGKDLRFFHAGDAVDPAALDGIRYVVVEYSGDRFIVVDVAAIRRVPLVGTWGVFAAHHGITSKPKGMVKPTAQVGELRVTRADDGELSVLLPGDRPRTYSVTTGPTPRTIGFGGGAGYIGVSAASGNFTFWKEAFGMGALVTGGGMPSPMPSLPPEKPASKKSVRKKASPRKGSAKKATPSALSADSVTTAFNAEFEGHDRKQPLELNKPCVLAFYAGKPNAKADATVDGNVVFQEGELDAKLTIHLTSGDFTTEQPSQELIVKRDGTSRGRARFDVTPTNPGKCTLVATIVKDGNFVQKIDIVANVGVAGKAIAKIKSAGRAFTADETIQPRDLLLLVEQTPDGGIEIIAAQKDRDPVRGHSDMTAAGLADLSSSLRARLKWLIENKFDDAAKRVAYTEAIDIAPAIHAATLAELAEESYAMFRSIFFEAGADEGMQSIGYLLASLADGPPRDIQIVTSRFVIPWQLVYAAPAVEPVQARHFLGFSHRIEHLALRSGWSLPEAKINTADLRISVNVNRGIDEELEVKTIEEQMKFFGELAASGKVKIEVRDTVASVKKALADPQLADQIIYLYCHAVSNTAGEGVGKSALLFEGKEKLT